MKMRRKDPRLHTWFFQTVNRPGTFFRIILNVCSGIREDLRHQHFSFTEIAKKVGESWQMLSPEQKGQYESQAASAKEKYHQAMMSYKTTDAHREYQRYLANFKAKHGSNTGSILISQHLYLY